MTSHSTNLPKAVYFDTNTLMQLPYWSSNVDFIELRKSAQLIRAPLFVPDLVAKEIVQRRIETASDQLKEIQKIANSLGKLFNADPLKYEKVDNVDETITILTSKFFEDIGVEVIPIPDNISVHNLIDMAVKKEAPFQGIGSKGVRGDKGFKDTIILFSIIEHMTSLEVSDAIFLTVDNVFSDKELLSRLKSQGVNLAIAKNFRQATDYINTNIDQLVKQHLDQESQKIGAFLESRFGEISQYIFDNVEISENFIKSEGLMAGLLGDKSIGNVTVKKILKITPKKIISARPGLIDKNKPEIKNTEAITFSVSMEFNLLVQEYGFGLFGFDSETFPISDPEAFENIKATPSYREPQTKETTVVRDLTIDAYVHLINGEYDKLVIMKAYSY